MQATPHTGSTSVGCCCGALNSGGQVRLDAFERGEGEQATGIRLPVKMGELLALQHLEHHQEGCGLPTGEIEIVFERRDLNIFGGRGKRGAPDESAAVLECEVKVAHFECSATDHALHSHGEGDIFNSWIGLVEFAVVL